MRQGSHLRAMKKGDEVLFYHSNEGMEIVGIAKVDKEAYQDPTTEDTNWVAVDLKPYKKLKKPVSLSQIKADKRLKEMALVRIGRLSVQPVTEKEWKIIMELAGGVVCSLYFVVGMCLVNCCIVELLNCLLSIALFSIFHFLPTTSLTILTGLHFLWNSYQ